MKNILVCTAWPYANGPLHLGHFAGCFLPADIFARYQRMAGHNVLMVSGSDQHGTPITVTAEKEQTTPEEVANRFHEINYKSLEKMNISYDRFSKTHDDYHFEVVHDIFKTLLKKNYIFKKKILAPYCPTCKRFLPDRYIEGTCPECGYEGARGDQCDHCGKTLDAIELVDARCNLCSTTPIRKETEQFYLRLSHLEGHLWNMLEGKDYWRPAVRGLTRGWLEEGLRDRAITRDLKWGVPIPLEGYDEKCIYVWFEAVIGYLSCTKRLGEKLGDPELWKDFWVNENGRIYYFLAKDNIPFHTLIFPAILAGYDENLNLPYDVPSNQYLTLNNEQFSKSRNHAVWIPSYLERFAPDVLRYYLTINMPEYKDTDFTWKNFVRVINEDLISTLGNMIHRVLVLNFKYYGEIPGRTKDYKPDKSDLDLVEAITIAREDIARNIDQCHFQKAVKALMNLAKKGNEYLGKKEPWRLKKTKPQECQNILHNLSEVIQSLSLFTHPFMPETSRKIFELMGNEGDVGELKWNEDVPAVKVGHRLKKPLPLFEKLDLEKILEREKEAGGEKVKAKKKMPIKKEINFKQFQALDIRIARVMDVKPHPDARNLYVLNVDIGADETVQMVAGLKKHYTAEEIEGKKIAVIVNLEPATIRGVRSNAMLLAASDDDGTVSIIGPTRDVAPGSLVH